MLRSSIDLGTNTGLLLIAEWDPVQKSVTRVISDRSTIVRLGQGVDQARMLQEEPKARALRCLTQYADELKSHGLRPEDTICVATSQARDAKNGLEFFGEVQKELGFRFQVISGAEEAKFTFLGGLLPDMSPNRTAIVDIGGGSTEFMSTLGGKSLDIGSVRFTERFFKSGPNTPVTDDEFWDCQDAIDLQFLPLHSWKKSLVPGTELVGVAGTVTTLAAWHLGLEQFDAEKINQCTLTRGDIHRMVEELKWRTVEERKAITGIEEGRADVLLAGAMILWRGMELMDFQACRVSTRGLRFGILTIES